MNPVIDTAVKVAEYKRFVEHQAMFFHNASSDLWKFSF
jgi:hypothetical protein